MSEVTEILDSIGKRGLQSVDDLLPLVYDELKRLAVWRMQGEAPGHTLQPTALVHEAYLRLVGGENQRFENSRHFFSAAAEAMRRILIDHARRKARQKHGGGWSRVDLTGLDLATDADDETLIFVHEAVDRLSERDSVCAELVKLRFFAGVSNKKSAAILGLSERTAKRNWAYARAWLKTEIESGGQSLDRD